MFGRHTEGTGLVATCRRVVDRTLATVENRLRLFGLELKEEKYRFIEALLWASAVVVFGAMGVVFSTLTIVALFWESPQARFIVMATFSLLYMGGAVFSYVWLRKKLKETVEPFRDTVRELKRDRECLNIQD